MNRPRDLCWRCYQDPKIRRRYKSQSKYATKRSEGPEPTLAELEAQIAERSKPENLPKWWFKEQYIDVPRCDGKSGTVEYTKRKWAAKRRAV